MIRAMTALLLLCAAPAQGLSVQIRFFEGRASYSRTVKVRSSESSNHAGVIEGAAGRRSFILNYLPIASMDGAVDLQYQVELSRADRKDGPLIQAQGELVLRPGRAVTALDCGIWRIEFRTGGGKTPPTPEEFGASDGNMRVTAVMADAGERVLCAQVMMPGVTSNAADSFKSGDEFSGFTMQTTAEPQGGKVRLSYTVEHTPRGGGGARDWKADEVLRYGERADAAGSGGRLGFLVEGAAPPEGRGGGGAPGGAGGGAPPPAAEPPAAAARGPVRWVRHQDETLAFDYPEGWRLESSKGKDRVADGFQLLPPKARRAPGDARAWAFVPPYSRKKEAPGGDYTGYLWRLMKIAAASKEEKVLVKPTRAAVKGGQCYWVVRESLRDECRRLSGAQRRQQADGCYAATHFQDCLSDKGLRLSAFSPLGGYYREPGRLGPEQEELLGYARRRFETFEFRGAVPASAFLDK